MTRPNTVPGAEWSVTIDGHTASGRAATEELAWEAALTAGLTRALVPGSVLVLNVGGPDGHAVRLYPALDPDGRVDLDRSMPVWRRALTPPTPADPQYW